MAKIVSIYRHKTYYRDALLPAVRALLAPLGGMSAFVKPGQTVALKPNLLRRAAPDTCIITHPEFIRAVCELVLESGGKPIIVEGPGGPSSPSIMKSIFEKGGYYAALSDLDIQIVTDCSSREVTLAGQRVVKMQVLEPVLDSDVFINLVKLKTHTLTALSGCVKNTFGIIPGLAKADYHFSNQNGLDFANAIIDIHNFRKPDLNIVDGIYALSGNGPGTAGDPYHLGLMLAGDDGFAVDSAICDIISLPRERVPFFECADARGIGYSYETVGQNIADVCVSNFSHSTHAASSGLMTGRVPKFLEHFVNGMLDQKPKIILKSCIGCNECATICPAKVITMVDHKAVIDKSGCISCHCCAEICPRRAVRIKKSSLFSVVDKVMIRK